VTRKFKGQTIKILRDRQLKFHGSAVGIADSLGEDAAGLGLAGACGPVLPFAFDSAQFLPTHGRAGAVAADVEHGNGIGARERRQSREGFAETGRHHSNETAKVAWIEVQSGVGRQIEGGFPVGTRPVPLLTWWW